MSSNPAQVHRQGQTLAFAGALVRDAVPGLWPQALAGATDATGFDLQAVTRIDSAGLALLAALAARTGHLVQVQGLPDGLADLRAAYRLTPSLAFAGGGPST